MDQPYDASHITVLEFPDVILERPGMFFGVGLDHPELPTRLVALALAGAVHPAARLAENHAPVVTAQILDDLTFVVEDDQVEPPEEGREGHAGLLGSMRWEWHAITAVCSEAVIETRRDGRGLRERAVAGRAAASPEPFDAERPGSGTRVLFRLDPALLAPDATIGTDLTAFAPECRYCDTRVPDDRWSVRDLRRISQR